MRAAGTESVLHQERLSRPRRTVAYDPRRISHQAVHNLVVEAAGLCGAVEGLSVVPGIPADRAFAILRDKMLRVQRELVRIGAINPADPA